MNFGFSFHDLYDAAGLKRLHHHFTDTYDAQKPMSYEVESYIAGLFGIEKDLLTLQQELIEKSLIPQIRRDFIVRRALLQYPKDHAAMQTVPSSPFAATDGEWQMAQLIHHWLQDAHANAVVLEQAACYCAFRVYHDKGESMALFRLPQKNTAVLPQINASYHGFDMFDQGPPALYSVADAHYCIRCHPQQKDSCRKGIKNTSLQGCPLNLPISEMITLYTQGHVISALAMAMTENPLIMLTGHRICQDCRQSCIFQKQTSVDVPAIESQIVKDVLNLPYGFEVISLLSRWNPLNIQQPYPKPFSGKKVMVAGMGPAGIMLSHYLLNAGHCVVGMDAMKIEPINPLYTGITPTGDRAAFSPIKQWHDVYESLIQRVPYGFGGVMEYGITKRFDKNHLTLARLLVERRRHFLLKGGVRFGGTVTLETAKTMGFDHVALCIGAGGPKPLGVKNGQALGVNYASDFLMTLHLSGLYRADTMAEYPVRLPLIVIGEGLTALDAATEALSYYPVLVQKFKKRYDVAVSRYGKDAVIAPWRPLDHDIAAVYLAHAQAIEDVQGDPKALLDLLNDWGGVTLLYRGSVTESKAYQSNAPEFYSAISQGVKIKEHTVTRDCDVDAATGHITGLVTSSGDKIACKTVLVAIGVQERLKECPDDAAFSTYFGDLDPHYKGSVVKAMASAKVGYPKICAKLDNQDAMSEPLSGLFLVDAFFDTLNKALNAVITHVEHTKEGVILKIQAPLAAQHYKSGHWYKLQTFEAEFSTRQGEEIAPEGIAQEGIALVPTCVRGDILTFTVYERGASSAMMKHLKPGERVILMGPTGGCLAAKNEANTKHLPLRMQCMLKGLCGQCIVKHGDQVVFGCTLANGESLSLTAEDTQTLMDRLKANNLFEKLNHLYFRNAPF